ncbi:major facilitator superfamily protein [Striga asiatica]|uniref:Major facilitator superfamily protein n=1 Tax=Striga asiatica TaxID=4170 RepID=A0A5A7QUL9_STRAF|nr:major facilitator superfamily protein [Striga asiatica]
MTLAGTGTETLTLFLVNLAGIMDNADEQLLPAVYKEVGESLHADPTHLGSLTFYKSFVQALCFPVAAYLATRHNRTHVIALGAFLWAAATFLVAISSTFTEVAVSRGLNGIGLAIVIPSIQSLIADSTNESNRGTAFGWLHLTSSFGSVFGSLVAILLAPTTILGLEGSRVAFHLVAALSILVGILVHLFAQDPRYNASRIKNDPQEPTKSFLGEEARSLLREARDVINVPSFKILVGQGLELMGFSHGTTATIWSLFTVASSLGGLFGGKMGDFVARRLPDSGRIILAQVSTGLAVPLAAVLILGLPDDSSTAILHGFVFVVMGLVISWCAPATNNPIFAEIVPERARTSIYALDRSFETILSSFAPPVVGLLSQNVFGYKTVDSGNVETDKENARALGKALYVSIGIPFTICCLIYSFLHCTYPGDRDRAKMASFIESQTQDIETDNSYVLIRDEPNVPSEEDTSADCRETDEQRLLSV